MSLFIESIKIFEGKILNLDYHSRRFNHTRQCFFPEVPLFDLGSWIRIPDDSKKGIYKCRVIYGEEIENIEFEPYDMRPVTSLKIVYDDEIDYSFKYYNRKSIKNLLLKKDNRDDIIIVKYKRITDSSYANLVFLSHGIWYTPRFPLLKGTKREQLLAESKISECDIGIHDLTVYESAGLINAMIDLGDCVIDLKNID